MKATVINIMTSEISDAFSFTVLMMYILNYLLLINRKSISFTQFYIVLFQRKKISKKIDLYMYNEGKDVKQ
jgi:hypothetical protein